MAMKKGGFWLARLVIVAALALFSGTVPALAQGPALVLHPSAAALAMGGTLVLELRVLEVTDLYGVEAHLSFDPAVLEVIDADAAAPGVQVELVGSFIRPDFVAQNLADNSKGTIDIAFVQVNAQNKPAVPATGSGTLARIEFRAKAAGTSAISFREFILSGVTGGEVHAIAARAEGSTVAVQGAAQAAQPSPTPTATAIPPTPTLPPTPTPAAAIPTLTPTPALPTPTSTPAAPISTATVEAAPTGAGPAATATATRAPTATAAQLAAVAPTATLVVAELQAQGTGTATPQGEAEEAASTPTASSLETVGPSPAAVETGAAPADVPAGSSTPTPAKLAAAVEAGTAQAAMPGRAAAEPIRRSAASSLWLVAGLVGAIIVIYGLAVVVPKERRRRPLR
jgi:hypothetical protein